MSKEEFISIKGARTHNLKNIDLEIPKEKIIVMTGVSGSGKSSLAFDTLFAEGQRRYIESLSPYARQFLGQMDRPDVDEIKGLMPSIAINQKALSHNPRSIVATLTEIYDYLRVLFSRIGDIYCPVCGEEIKKLAPEEIFNLVKSHMEKEGKEYTTISAPVVYGRKGEYYQLLYEYLKKGYSEAIIDGKVYSLRSKIKLSRYQNHTIEIIIDRPRKNEPTRLFEAIEAALESSDGLVKANEILYSSRFSCKNDGFAFPEIEPRLFSFNSPYGACPTCMGLGKESIFSDQICPDCLGKRLKKEALSVKIKGKNIWQTIDLTIEEAYEFFFKLSDSLSEKENQIASKVLKEIINRIGFLLEVGLDYITLNREAGTLSGGEAQRIRLASQIGSGLSNTLYVLDEPTIGLHEKDTEKLIKTLKNLRDLNNTIVLVEHDEKTINNSDFLVDLGPMAGKHGGEIVAIGKTKELIENKKYQSLTLDYLRGDKQIAAPLLHKNAHEKLKFSGVKLNNLKNINVEIPLRRLVAITGVSGSGKSSLLEVINDSLKTLLSSRPRSAKGGLSGGIPQLGRPGDLPRDDNKINVKNIENFSLLNKVTEINQSPIGRTPRSNPATYTGIFAPIRDFFASLEDARARGYTKSRFSFNLKGGRCEACEGAGFNLVEMHFLPPVLVRCEVCLGKRFNRETLEVKYNNKNIADVLDLTIDDAADFFHDIYLISEKLKLLKDIGLGYLKLGQSATTLSGGEAQRIKLAKELSQTANRTLYLLDEPTTGLHYYDIELLIEILQKLVNRGNTVVLIEHNLHLIKVCDYVIDLGPEGGAKGGRVLAVGKPTDIAENEKSVTGRYLKEIL